MISLNDFKEKEILFISALEDNIKIRLENDNVIFEKDGKIINRLSCYKILAIFIIGDLTITTKLIKNCVNFGISIFLMKDNFEIYTSIESRAEGNYLLREKQYSSDIDNDLYMSKQIVKNKFLNQRTLLRNFNKNYKDTILNRIDHAKDNASLLGIEGSYSKNFFKQYFKDINWYRREPRTKIDINNLLLDIGYTYLFNYVDCLLRLYGFDNYKGFYHKLFFQRKSLSCDIVEPFRCIIDKQLLKAYNLKQINENDFKFDGSRYLLEYNQSKKYTKIFFEAIIDYKEYIFNYIYDFYRYMCDNNEYEFPIFNIK